MNEALFRLPWLLNYSVTMTGKDGKRHLGIEVLAKPEARPKADGVLRLLHEIPAIREGVLGGHLQLEPIHLSERNWFTDGTAKRSITVYNAAERTESGYEP